MTWALKNVGMMLIACALLFVAQAIDHWADELHHNTAKISCTTGETALAYAIPASALQLTRKR